MNEEAIKYLIKQGSCWRCIKLFQGETSALSFLDIVSSDIKSDSYQENCLNESVYKKPKVTICCSCLGILQLCSSIDLITKLSSTIIDGGYDAPVFSLSLSLPICLGLRLHSIWAHLLNKFPTENIKTVRTNHIGVLKDVWRNIVGPLISERVSKQFVSGQVVNLSLAVQAVYPDDETECLLLEKINVEKFIRRRKQHKKFQEGVFTRQVVEDTLNELSDKEFIDLDTKFPSEPSKAVEYQSSCTHSSLFLAGRYNKFSRHLSQTPWFVDGERRMESSVQEKLSFYLENFIKSDSVKFSASGREDVDVRCLGSGRPFVLEFINPKRTVLDLELLQRLQNEVNQSTDLIAIRDLQVISRKDLNYLKEGEEEKTKSYCALCVSREDLEEETLMSLESIKDLVLDQITPIRVLHRRSLSTRPRSIHSMSVDRINERFFKLSLRTQAGTYIKEFVHGDFGRTTPNLGSLLNTKIDILALDVEGIQLQWPPTIQAKKE